MIVPQHVVPDLRFEREHVKVDRSKKLEDAMEIRKKPLNAILRLVQVTLALDARKLSDTL